MQLTLLSFVALAVAPFAPAVSATWHPSWTSDTAPSSKPTYGAKHDNGYAPSNNGYSNYNSHSSSKDHGSSAYGSDDDDDESYGLWKSQKRPGSKWSSKTSYGTNSKTGTSVKNYGNSYVSSNSQGSKYYSSSSDGTKSVTVLFDPFYDNAAESLNGVACSNGENGLVSEFPTFGDIPNFPYLAAAPVIEGWNSEQCGTCWELSYEGNTIYVTAVDRAAKTWNLPTQAIDELTNRKGRDLGVVNGVQLKSADPSKCYMY